MISVFKIQHHFSILFTYFVHNTPNDFSFRLYATLTRADCVDGQAVDVESIDSFEFNFLFFEFNIIFFDRPVDVEPGNVDSGNVDSGNVDSGKVEALNDGLDGTIVGPEEKGEEKGEGKEGRENKGREVMMDECTSMSIA